jgi:hypothetical protein
MLFYFILFTEWLILNFQEHDWSVCSVWWKCVWLWFNFL